MKAVGAARAVSRFLTGIAGSIAGLAATILLLVPTGVLAQSASNTYLYTSTYSVNAGTPVTFTVGVGGSNPTGTVTFRDGSTVIGTRTLAAGEATLNASFTLGGGHVITAAYSGDANNLPSTSSPLTVTVAHGASSTVLVVTPNPVAVGGIFHLRATVTGSNPTGYVSLYDNGVFLTTVSLNAGVADLDWLSYTAGTHTWTAVFADDYYNATSTSNAVALVVGSQASSTTTLASSINPSGLGQSTTLAATVTGSSPTGTVTFKDGATTLGTATLTSGVATLSRNFSTTGAHSLTAIYGGDGANTASTSAALTQTVNTLANTITVLSSSVNPSSVGQSTLLTATVTGSAPTGNVTFMDGATTLGVVALSSGVATRSTSFAASGAHSLTAVYAGNASNAASTSSALTQTVNAQATSTTVLASGINPSIVGQSTLLTATVTGTSPSGTVTFKDGATTLGTGTVSAGKATFNASFAATGSHSLTAVYSGDAGNLGSTSAALTQTVNAQTVSTTALTSSVNPSGVGQSTLLTATIAGTAPTGTVTFKDGATTLGTGTVSASKATLSVPFSTAGAHSLTAQYSGDVANTASTSAALTQTVNALASSTTTLVSSINPSVVAQNTTLTATVTGTSPSGTVTFKDGAMTLGTGTLSGGIATLVSSFAVTGAHSLTAAYAGDVANTPSTSAAVSQTVNSQTTSTTALASSVNPSFVNQTTTLTATVTGTSPTGTVTFKDGATTLGTATLAGGTATLARSFTTVGAHSLTAVYAGDVANTTSTSAVRTQTVNALTATTTVLSSSINPAFVNQNTVLTATITGASPTGTVTFKDGATTLGTGTISAGKATLTKSFSTTGAHSLTAVYAGDVGNATSTSAALSQTVNAQTTTTTALTSSVNPAYVGQGTTLTATVTGTGPTGSIVFKDGATTLGTVTLSAGVATLATSFATTGAHSLTAAYSGDAGNKTSTSAALSETVNAKVTSTTVLTSSVNPSGTGQTTTLRATVTGSSPTGTITFKNGANVLATAPMTAGVATASFSFSPAGSYSLTASYAGDVANNASTSAAVTQVVNAVATSTTVLASSVNPTTPVQNTTLTATVTGASPTGTVTFMEGATVLGTGTLSAGKATLVKSFAAGSHGLTAVYAGDAANGGSTSAVLTQTVNKVVSSVAVSSTPNPSKIAEAVTVTAVVTGSAPTGTVWFIQDGATIGTGTLASGRATYTYYFTTLGAHTISANYGGDAVNASATAPNLTQTVGPAATTSTLSVSANPALDTDVVTLSASVSSPAPATPTGTVTFKDGATVLGNVPLAAGLASMTKTFTVGMHNLTATYSGDANNLTSTSTVVAEDVRTLTTSTSLASSPNPSALGQSVTLTATLTGGYSPNGMTVVFKDGAANLGSATLVNRVATFTTSFATPGVHALTASFAGNGQNLASTSPILSQGVNPTVTSLASGTNPSHPAQSVVLTATVSGGASPAGTVTFTDGANTLGTVALVSGVATLSTSFASAGDHTVLASYGGNATNGPSSGSLVQRVWTANIGLAASANPAAPGQPVTLTANVVGTNPTGTMTFKDGAAVLGTAPVVAGSATFNASFATLGVHVLTASYSGDANNGAGNSDPLSEQISPAVTGPAPMTWSFTYNPVGSLTSVVDPNANKSVRTYDLLNRLATLAESAPAGGGTTGPAIVFGVDGQDRTTSVKDPRGLTTSYGVNGLGNVASQTSPDTGAASATFDAAGNRLTQTDARGKTTTYTYDALNRVKTISYPTGTGTVFEYDGGAAPYPGSTGKLTKLTDESGVTTFGFDALGRPISRSALVGAKTLSVAYAWGTTGGATGKISSITYPSGARVNYVYDTAGRVQALTVNPPNANGVGTNTGAYFNILAGIAYNADNAIKGWTWANNAPYVRTFDGFGRLSDFPIGYPQGAGNAAGLTRTLGYDNAGRVTSFSHANAGGAQVAFNQGFGYDGLDRLKQQTTAALTYGYAYDANGNRTALTQGANTYANTVSPTSNRLTNVQTPGTGGVPVNNAQTYTASGSLTGDGVATYAYSDRGRLSSSTFGGSTTTYKYNGLEQRVSKTGTLVPTGSAYYGYDEEGKTLGEYDANLYPVAETVYIGTMPVAVFKLTGSGAASTLALSIGNVYADQIDTPRVITRNSDEGILWRWDGSEAFGNTQPSENPAGLGVYKYNQRMPGQVFDAEDQNFYNWNRDYQPRTGRFLEADPIGILGVNLTSSISPSTARLLPLRRGGTVPSASRSPSLNGLYPYADANPVGLTDPDGLEPTAASIALGGLRGGIRGGRGGGVIGAVLGVSIGVLSEVCEPTDRDRDERQCDADYDAGQKFCHAMAVTKGRHRGTKKYAETYRQCMAVVEEEYVDCYQRAGK